MTKLNMELSEDDLDKLDFLKKTLGLSQNTEVVRFCITKIYKEEKNLE